MAWTEDWISKFLDYTEGITSPDILRLWCAISAVAGALERRVWVETAQSLLYPNLFTLLVAPPGVGKSQAIYHVSELWYQVKKFHVAPDNVTKAALVDALQAADRKIVTPNSLVEYHALLVPSSEFGVLVPAHDLEFLSVLNHIYDCPRVYRENRRSLNKNIEIVFPQLNILAGTQPGFLANLLPEEAWSMGFTSRIIMVYAGIPPTVPIFVEHESEEAEAAAKKAKVAKFYSLLRGMEAMAKLMGQATWEPEAKRELERWAKERCPPIPDHSKLQHYNARRIVHAIKLCIVSAVSRTGELLISLEDLNRARDWLLHVEQIMPDIFREMVQRSDSTVIQELHFFMWRLHIKEKKPIHESRIFHFLQTRLPADKLIRVLDIAEKSSIITKIAGTSTYVPRPKTEHGLE